MSECPIRVAKQKALQQIHEMFAHKSSSKANNNRAVTNLGDFTLKKCSVDVKRLPVATKKSDEVVENPESSAVGLSAHAKRLLHRHMVMQANTVNEKKRDTATSKGAKPKKLNRSTPIETADIDKSTIRKMANCSVNLKRLSPEELRLLGTKETQKSSADDREKPNTSKRLLRQNGASQENEKETVSEVVMAMPKPFLIKTECNSELEVPKTFDESLDDDDQGVPPKKGGRTKQLLRWNMEKMDLSGNVKPKWANQKEQTITKQRATEPKPKKSSKMANGKKVNENDANDENNYSTASSSAASKSANVTKRMPMKNLVSTFGRSNLVPIIRFVN